MKDDGPPHAPRPDTQTLIQDRTRQYARFDYALWPPIGAVIEVEPPLSAIVQNVKLRLSSRLALVIVDIEVGSSDPRQS